MKLLLVDGRVAYFGGVNWGPVSYLNRDYELRLEGPGVQHLEHVFALIGMAQPGVQRGHLVQQIRVPGRRLAETVGNRQCATVLMLFPSGCRE